MPVSWLPEVRGRAFTLIGEGLGLVMTEGPARQCSYRHGLGMVCRPDLPCDPVERDHVIAARIALLNKSEALANRPAPPRPPRGRAVRWGRRLVVLVMVTFALVGCSSDADVASENLSKAAEQFEIDRRIVFVNGITDQYLLVVEGKCSIEDENRQLEVTCKTGNDTYKKHFLGLSDNVTYMAEQLEGVKASRFHYRVIFKPEAIVPDVDRP